MIIIKMIMIYFIQIIHTDELRGKSSMCMMCLKYRIIYTIICLKSVAVRKLQVAMLAQSPREMSQTDRIV